jgi:hypothetical protein
MLKYTPYLTALLLTVSGAHAQNMLGDGQNYIGISALVDGELEISERTVDRSSGYALTYGRKLDTLISAQITYTNITEVDDFYVDQDVEADMFTIAGTYHLGASGSQPFAKLGYANLDAMNGNDEGLLYGIGYDIVLDNNTQRVSYTLGDLDDVDYEKLTIGGIMRL